MSRLTLEKNDAEKIKAEFNVQLHREVARLAERLTDEFESIVTKSFWEVVAARLRWDDHIDNADQITVKLKQI